MRAPVLTLLFPILVACGADDAPATEAPAAAPHVAEVAASGAATATAAAEAAADSDWKTYGEAFTVAEDQTVACGDLLANPTSHVDATVRVSGRVADVCQAKGCWMVITPEDTDDAAAMIRVTMKDHAFSVDKQGAGSVTQLEGVLKAVEVDAETVEHYASEGGAGDAVPEKQGMKYELVASAVQMKPGAAPQ
jgi:hypothetical protein